MHVLLLTSDRNTARRYLAAAKAAGVRLARAETTAEALEQLFRVPFDALLFDAPEILDPALRRCPVLWPRRRYRIEAPPDALAPTAELTYCFSQGCAAEAVLSRVAALSSEPVRQTDARVLIAQFLSRVGVPPSMTGYRFLFAGVQLLLQSKRLTDASVGDVYARLAFETGASASAVEHAMRHAIDTAWMRADPAVLEEMFGNTVQSERAAPSNAAFLFRAAQQVRSMQRGERTMQTERSALPPGWEALTDATINAVMRALCVPTKLLGYRYIFFAVRTIRTEPDRDRAARRDMYAEIGSCMGTTRPMISRTIRYAVGQAWKHAAPEVLTSYLGSRGRNRKDPPGNIEFIYMVAERVRLILGAPLWESRAADAETCEEARSPLPIG